MLRVLRSLADDGSRQNDCAEGADDRAANDLHHGMTTESDDRHCSSTPALASPNKCRTQSRNHKTDRRPGPLPVVQTAANDRPFACRLRRKKSVDHRRLGQVAGEACGEDLDGQCWRNVEGLQRVPGTKLCARGQGNIEILSGVRRKLPRAGAHDKVQKPAAALRPPTSSIRRCAPYANSCHWTPSASPPP